MKLVELAHCSLEDDKTDTIARRRARYVNGDYEDVTDFAEMEFYDYIMKERDKNEINGTISTV